jgi:type I restriction enzyme S subunit
VEWLGEIPVHWEVKRIKDVTHINTDVLRDDTDADYTIQYIDIGNVSLQGVMAEPESLRFENAPSRARRRVNSGDTIISTVRTYLQAIAYFENPAPNLVVSTGFAVLRPGNGIHPKFLYYLVRCPYFIDTVMVNSVGVSYPAINPSMLSCLPVWIPPLPEQRAIAAYLDRETASIDTLIDRKQRLISLLQEKRTTLISHAVTRGLDPFAPLKPSGVEWLAEIPAHWEIRRIKMVSSLITSGSRGWAAYYSEEGAIFLRIGNLTRTSIALDLTDIQHVSPPVGAEGARTRVRSGDVLTSITAYIGSVAVVKMDIGTAYVNQHIALIRPRTNVILPEWLGYCLLSRVGSAQFGQLLYGGTKDGLGLDDVANLLILLPPMLEQCAIVQHIEEETAKIDTLIAKVRRHIAKLQEYRTALISAAVTGKIDVTLLKESHNHES